jgi:hypothetical protein
MSSACAELGDRLARFSPGAPQAAPAASLAALAHGAGGGARRHGGPAPPASPAACAHLAGVAALARARALAAPLAGAGAPPPLAPLLAALEVRRRGVWGAVWAVYGSGRCADVFYALMVRCTRPATARAWPLVLRCGVCRGALHAARRASLRPACAPARPRAVPLVTRPGAAGGPGGQLERALARRDRRGHV